MREYDLFPGRADGEHQFGHARDRARRIMSCDIWTMNGSAHEGNRRRWFTHGIHEARVALLYYQHYPEELPDTVSLEDILLGFILHDIGKAETVDDPHVWHRRREDISLFHWDAIRRHTEVGAEILRKYEVLTGEQLPAVVYDIVRYHHEKLDRSGKPFGMSGDELSAVVRLASVIDQWMSRVEKRAYHDRHFTLAEAYEDIAKGVGIQYDGGVVVRLHALFHQNVHMKDSLLGWLGPWDESVY